MPGGWQPRESWRRSLAVIVAAGTVAAVAACGTSRTRTAPARPDPPGELSACCRTPLPSRDRPAAAVRIEAPTRPANCSCRSRTDAVGVSGVQLLNGPRSSASGDGRPAASPGPSRDHTTGQLHAVLPGAAVGRSRFDRRRLDAGRGSNLQQLLDRPVRLRAHV